jgi:hypothetical protein
VVDTPAMLRPPSVDQKQDDRKKLMAFLQNLRRDVEGFEEKGGEIGPAQADLLLLIRGFSEGQVLDHEAVDRALEVLAKLLNEAYSR